MIFATRADRWAAFFGRGTSLGGVAFGTALGLAFFGKDVCA